MMPLNLMLLLLLLAAAAAAAAAPVELVVEHGSANVGRAYSAAAGQSASAGLPVLAAKGEAESAQLVRVDLAIWPVSNWLFGPKQQ